jgi:hypothetical protein
MYGILQSTCLKLCLKGPHVSCNDYVTFQVEHILRCQALLSLAMDIVVSAMGLFRLYNNILTIGHLCRLLRVRFAL